MYVYIHRSAILFIMEICAMIRFKLIPDNLGNFSVSI